MTTSDLITRRKSRKAREKINEGKGGRIERRVEREERGWKDSEKNLVKMSEKNRANIIEWKEEDGEKRRKSVVTGESWMKG